MAGELTETLSQPAMDENAGSPGKLDARDVDKKELKVEASEHLAASERLIEAAEEAAEQGKALIDAAEGLMESAQDEAEAAIEAADADEKPAIAAAVSSLTSHIDEVKEDIAESLDSMKKAISDFVPDEIENNVIYVAKGVGWLLEDFTAFVSRGNVLDLAVGVIIGSGFTGIVNATVDDFLSPFLSSLSSGGQLINNFALIRPGSSGNTTYDTYEAARTDGAVAFYYGHWLQSVLNFLFVAPVLYLLVRLFAVTQDQLERELMECPFCLDKVPKKAVKCRACASVLKQPVGYEAVVKTVGVKSLSAGKGQ